MKLNKVILGAFALSMSFASCSNEEPVKGGENNVATDGEKYMAFSITNVGGSSRAADDYEDAAGTEGDITKDNLYFLFFDRNGNAFNLEGRTVNGEIIHTNMVQPANISWNIDQMGNETMTGTLVLGKRANPDVEDSEDDPFLGQTPAQVLCVANPKTSVMKDLGGQNLSAVLKAQTSTPDFSQGEFLMTNSTYVGTDSEGKDAVITATSTVGCIKDTPAEAENSPVMINLERVAAKVRANYDAEYEVTNNTATPATETFEINGTETKVYAQIQGWRLMNYATKAWGFKQLSTSYTFTPTWVWNDPTNKRSYWAESLVGNDLSNTSYNLYPKEGEADQFILKSFGTNKKSTANVAYCYENTLHTDATVTDRTAQATGIVVKVVLGTKAEGGDFTPVDMVKFAGKLYTVDHFKEIVIAQFKSNNKDAVVKAVNFLEDVKDNNTWKAEVVYDDDKTFDMSYIYKNFLWWQNGITSYWINIKHFGDLTGIVRNHIYDYDISEIYGLGVPGNEPGKHTETETYMAAALRVLNWRVVSNSVILQ